jgi:hypothetical protein
MISYYIEGRAFPEFDYDRLFRNPSLSADDLLAGIYFPNQASDIENSFDIYRNVCGIDLPDAFQELKNISPIVSSSFLVFVGKSANRFNNTFGYIHKHIHPPEVSKDLKYISPSRRSTTVIVPTKIKNSISETLCIQKVEYDFYGKDYIARSYQTEEWLSALPKVGDEIRIRMPSEGEYLVLDFESSHTLHWIENEMDSENEFICLVNDI